MRPSPIREEYHRFATPRNAAKTATAATVTPTTTTTPSSLVTMPPSISSRSSSGLTTVIHASSAVAIRKIVSWTRWGRAEPAILLIVPGLSFCLVTDGSMRNPRAIIMPGPCTIPASLVRPASGLPLVIRPRAKVGPGRKSAQAVRRRLLGDRSPLGGAAPAPEGDTHLGQDAVNESVGTPGLGGQRADRLPRLVPPGQAGGELAAVRPGHPGTSFEVLGHVYLP